MLTSFAPSPIASVETFGLFSRTKLTICCFYFGETLQQSTELQWFVIIIRSVFGPSCIAWISASPVMINALLSRTLFDASMFFSIAFLTSRSYRRISLRLTSSSLSASSFFTFTICWFKSWLSNLHENPMLIAVSTLSPVSTQTLIPADFSAWIVGPTSSCNLSSIAVAPTRIKSFSSYACTFVICSSRSWSVVHASWYYFDQSKYSSGEISR